MTFRGDFFYLFDAAKIDRSERFQRGGVSGAGHDEVAKAICAMALTLEGLDCLVFTGGIGEHAAPARAMVCSK